LPTGDLQSRNYPLLYQNLTPVLCQNCQLEIDDNSHIGRCINTKKDINQAFRDAKILLISLPKELEDVNDFLVENSIDSLKCLEEININSQPIPNSHHIYLWAHNIVPNKLILFLHSHIKHTRQLKTVLWKFLDIFMKNIRKIMWINRCDLMRQWEQNNNITKTEKRFYKTRANKDKHKNIHSRQHKSRAHNHNRQSNNTTDNNDQNDTSSFDIHNSSLFAILMFTKAKSVN
jgi:hypothetical protein